MPIQVCPRKSCELKVMAMRIRNNPHWRWYAAGLLLISAAQAQIKTPVAPAPVSASDSCVIAEFRRIALTHHDPQERQDKVIAWLQKNGASCSPAQMSILISSRASLMGTADTSTLSSAFDAVMEKKIATDHAALSRYYQPVVQGPPRGSAAAAPETTSAGPAGAAGAAGGAATGGPAGGAGAPGANMTGVAVMGQAPGMMAGMPPGTQNINLNMGGPKPPEEDMSRKLPLPSEPMFQFPPEFGTPMLNYFGKLRRQFTRSFFMETLSPGKCPEGLTWRNDGCEANFKAAWRFGEKIPQGTKTFPVEPKLVEKLNFDPGYTFVRIGADILALERDTGKVADAVLNLGKAS